MPARSVAATILIVALAVPLLRIAMPAAASPTAPIPMRPVTAAPPAVKTAHAIVASPATKPPPETPPASAPIATTLAIHHVIDTGGAIRYGSYFWDDSATPAGPLTITVDLKASVLSVFRGGDEIGTTAVIYGADDRETPLGTFPILQKDRHHFSSRYHHAPMPYMLRLTGDGISIHASEIAADYATHGCIGVPAGFAQRLFAVARVGDRVIVTRKGLSTDLAMVKPIA